VHAAPVAARGRGGPRVATWFVSCDCGVFLTPHVSPSSRRHRGCDVACRVNACCRCRRTPHRAVPIDVDLTLKQSGSDFGAGDARWQGLRRTFKGAAIMTEDMVSEKAIVGVAMGRRGRTARTNCRRRAGKAPRKASRSARREPRRKNQRKCATDRFSPENLSFFLHRTEPHSLDALRLPCPPSPPTPLFSRARPWPARGSPPSAPRSTPKPRSASAPTPAWTSAIRTQSSSPPASCPPTSPPSALRYVTKCKPHATHLPGSE
jgi:hypothetical protein